MNNEWVFSLHFLPLRNLKAIYVKSRVCTKKVDWAKLLNRYSSKCIWVAKWSPHGRIILAKGQLDHSYTFWTMANYTYYTSMKFADSHVRWIISCPNLSITRSALLIFLEKRLVGSLNFFKKVNCATTLIMKYYECA